MDINQNDKEFLIKHYSKTLKYKLENIDSELNYKTRYRFIKGLSINNSVYYIYEVKYNGKTAFQVVNMKFNYIMTYKKTIRDAINYVKIFEIMENMITVSMSNMKEYK